MPMNTIPVQCPYCPKQLKGVGAAKLHVGTKHKNKPMPKTFEPVATSAPDTPTPPTPVPSPSPNQANGHVLTKDLVPDEKGVLLCPECPTTVPNRDYKRMGRHRRFSHGIIGHKHNVKNPTGSRKTGRQSNQERGIVHVPDNQGYPQLHAETNFTIDPLAYGVAVGKVEELCLRFAAEHDFPPRMFTRHVAELFLRQARR